MATRSRTCRPRRRKARWLRVALAAAAAASFSGCAAYGTADATARAQAAERFPVTAVLVHDAHPPTYQAAVTWNTPDGSAGAGLIRLPREVPAGGRQTVWIDQTGRLSPAPLSRGGVVGHTVLVTSAVFLGSVLLLTAAGGVARVRRARRWARTLDIEWRLVGPAWRRHYLP